ncbi:hydroxymethylglutaryl-CoA lyase [Salicibibacter cibarius]|uniref:Hydroxymethylglutaryl-CoA lyase n=1 Tax=Salicibibacter cibarius TaxID=2743000 RepID=A0A7T7CDB0_9BACI|nr:hydroxymethylglutaryl-CoA lyase [Salicibibacter cibarius]QQK77807.1 hydroxymethylglutaryl-CoA lyase [Salicibibacter cibarius]
MIEICEVGPRDGLQNEKIRLTIEDRVEMIKKLQMSGIKKIEVASFVNAKVVPQMANAEEVIQAIPRQDGVRYAGLVLSPNGVERALACDLDDIHVVLAASTTFNLKNARRTTDESLKQLTPLIDQAKTKGRCVVSTIGNAFGCPFEGEVPFSRVLKIAEAFLEHGADQITLADTTGMADPKQVLENVNRFNQYFPETKLGLHFHNTRGLALANAYAGFQAGVRSFESSIGGLGGCPFAPMAVGNVCTEDLIHLFKQMNEETPGDLNQLVDTAEWVEGKVGHRLDGLVMKAGPA